MESGRSREDESVKREILFLGRLAQLCVSSARGEMSKVWEGSLMCELRSSVVSDDL
ncbi:hypothetical protein COLO4_37529 [Corchorus olitorius]|uniref:Uncharacterized protein n=1 Tax=Corchorus olitorius TaxID=93759 RepID=A0A1R3G100_9ROSI|nr:hypothetical protein COLO4_37529 [Corchorus olitorius]